jgi:sugar phosphate isomerase/epimerase
MKLGLFTPVFGKLSTREMLTKVQALGKVQAVELGTGGWPGADHIDLAGLMADQGAALTYRQMINDAGLTISALSCHGNPLHPVPKTAKEYDDVFRKTVCLAKRMEVPVVVTFAGCPGDSDGAKYPNW